MLKSLATAAAFVASVVSAAPMTTGSFTNLPATLTVGQNYTITWESDLQDTVYIAIVGTGLEPSGEAYDPFTGEYVPTYYSYTEYLADHQPSSGSLTWTVEPTPGNTDEGLPLYGPEYVYRFGLTPTHAGDGFGSVDFTLVGPE